MSNAQFEFGFAKEDITPAYGIPLCGYFNPRPNKGFYDRLHVKAAAFRCGEEYAAIVSCDLAFVTYDVIKELEETLQKEQCPLAGKTMFTATHTHTGPYPSTLFAFDNENNTEYISEMKEKILAAVRKAYASLAPAELYAAETECTTLAFNRRFIMKDGKTLTNPGKCNPEIDHPEGGIDPLIFMLQVRQHNRPVLLMANISNHSDTTGGDYVSADWPGAMEREIQKEFGYEIPVMTIIAPQGNINHFDVSTLENQTSYAEANRIGKGYAHAILSAQLRMTKQNDLSLAVRSMEFEAPYYQLSDEEYAEAKKIYEENKNEVMEEGRDFTSEDIARGVPFVKKFFAERAISCRENPFPGKRIEKQMSIVFNENIAFVSMPAEPFIEIGEAIREGSKYPMTFLAALSMGEIGYTGMPYHYGNGGYETAPSREMADKTVGETMIKNALDLLK